MTKYEELVQQWSSENPGTLNDYSPGSHKEMTWVCSKGHKWYAQIRRRFAGDGCPYCSGRVAIKGENDLETVRPDLVAEWHPAKNGSLLPSDVKPHSKKIVWWLCSSCGYEWKSAVYVRNRGKGCPLCHHGHRRATKETSLAVMNPEIASEWDYEKNIVTPCDVLPGSNNFAYWKCKKGHRWYSQIKSRTRTYRPNKCPYCSGKRVIPGETDLATTDPEIVVEFDLKNDIKPEEVTRMSHKKVTWICPKGHKYKMRVSNRVLGKGCPICAGNWRPL